jgi:hypothetical protein
MDRRRKWRFSLREHDATWAWHVSGQGRAETSATRFTSLEDCLADAARHGHVVWMDHDRRHPEFPGWDDVSTEQNAAAH